MNTVSTPLPPPNKTKRIPKTLNAHFIYNLENKTVI